MKRKRYTAEIRVRVSKTDHDRLAWLIERHSDQHTVSSLIRVLILREYERLQPKTAD